MRRGRGRGKQISSDSRHAQIHELKSSGLNQGKIAEILGCSPSLVSYFLRRGDNTKNSCATTNPLSQNDVKKTLAVTGKLTMNSGCPSNGEKLEGFRCFFCLSCNPVHFQRRNYSGSGVTKGNLNILLKYLLDTRNNKNEQLIKDIQAMLEDSMKKPLNQDDIPEIIECDKCKDESKRIAELHRELEKTQMKIVDALKSFKRKILQYFVKGSHGEELCKTLKSLMTTAVEYKATDAAASGDLQKLLEFIADFQIAVDEKGKESADVPCIILDKYAICHPRHISVEDFNVTVKAETTVDDANCNDFDGFSDQLNDDDDMNAFNSEYNDSLLTTSSATIVPKLKLRRKVASPVEFKVEIQEPPSKRKRPTVNYMISKTTRSSQEKVGNRSRKRPRKCIKRIKEASKMNNEKVRRKKKKQTKHRKIVCELCLYATYKSFKYEEHLVNEHETTLRNSSGDQSAQLTCDQCSKSFICKQLYTFHMEGHQGKYSFVCDSCNERIPFPEIEAHVRTHSDKIFRCINCSFCCTTRERYLEHLRSHGRGRLECDLCSKPVNTKTRLLEHLYQEHQVGTKYICEVANCNAEYFELARFKRHRFIHTNPHACSQCDKVYISLGSLKVHQRVHTDEKTIHCSECNELFRSVNGLNSHRILAHGAEKYKCEYCDKEYLDPRMLRIHISATHEGTGIPCGICNKMFGSKSLWRRHQIVHSKELSFICEECGKGFTSQAGLKRHSIIHGGEKKYKCQFCGKAFLYLKYLQDHERIHTGERPFTCEICGKGFNQRGSVNLHKKKAHGDRVNSNEDMKF